LAKPRDISSKDNTSSFHLLDNSSPKSLPRAMNPQ
jgi:hypothetical protein